MSAISRMCVAVLVPLLPAAQGGASEGQACSVEGVVLDGVSQQPLRKVEIILRRSEAAGSRGGGAMAPAYGALTNDSGRFAFTGVVPGSYMLSAQKTGYLPSRSGSRRTAGPNVLRLTAGQEVRGFTIHLTPQAVITGTVLDEDNEPVQGASVQVLAIRYFRGRPSPTHVGAGVTDDQGRYRIPGISPGKVVLLVAPQRQRSIDLLVPGREMMYPSIYHPGVTDIRQAARIEVPPGTELSGFDFRLQKARVYRIQGNVINGMTGQPLRNCTVSVLPREGLPMIGSGPSVSRNDQNGSFTANYIRPGAWQLFAQSMDGGERLQGLAAVDVGEQDIEGVMLQAFPPRKLEGAIRVSGEGPPGLSAVRLSLHPLEISTPGSSSATVQANGGFLFTGVYPRKYLLDVDGLPEQAYLESVKLGNEDVTGKALDFSNGVAGTLDVRLGMGAGSVAGVVRKGDNPAAGAMVVALPLNAALRIRQFIGTGTADESGAFRVGGLAPGEYLVLGVAEIEYGAWEDPEVMKPFETGAERLRIERNSSTTVQLKVQARAE
jgi:protocatechuate 3,4-dioxygenase beta subunit